MPIATTEDAESIAGLAMTLMASEPLRAGQPVFMGPDGTLYLSSASDASRSFVDGFARDDAVVGQMCQVEDRSLTLQDWTRVVGVSYLLPGTRYYLSGQYGRLQATAPTTAGMAAIRVGMALSSTTLRLLSISGTLQGGTAALLYGDGPPLNTLGVDGQGYVDKLADPRVLYVKSGGAWIVLLVGAVGLSGIVAGTISGSASLSGSTTQNDALAGSVSSSASLAGTTTIVSPPSSPQSGSVPSSAAASGTPSANDNLSANVPPSASGSATVSSASSQSGSVPSSASLTGTASQTSRTLNRIFAFGLIGAAI